MESSSSSGRIHCSSQSAKLLAEQAPDIPLLKRGKVGIKGKGEMVTYWVGNGSTSSHKPEHGAKHHVEFSA
jgi:hypothetical protein